MPPASVNSPRLAGAQVLSLLDDIRWPADGNGPALLRGGFSQAQANPLGTNAAKAKPPVAPTTQPEAAQGAPPEKQTTTKLPKFEPLPLMHSGLSGDLDLLFLPEEESPDGSEDAGPSGSGSSADE